MATTLHFAFLTGAILLGMLSNVNCWSSLMSFSICSMTSRWKLASVLETSTYRLASDYEGLRHFFIFLYLGCRWLTLTSSVFSTALRPNMTSGS